MRGLYPFLWLLKRKALFQNSQVQFSTQRRFICLWGTGGRDKRQREEIEDEVEWEGEQGRGERSVSPVVGQRTASDQQGDKHGQMVVYKGIEETLC